LSNVCLSVRDYTCSAGRHLDFRWDSVGFEHTAFFSWAARCCVGTLTRRIPRFSL